MHEPLSRSDLAFATGFVVGLLTAAALVLFVLHSLPLLP